MGNRSLQGLVAMIIAFGAFMLVVRDRSPKPEYDEAACAGPPLRSAQKRNDAMEQGYSINRYYDCIDKASFVEINRQKTEVQRARAEAPVAPTSTAAADSQESLEQARSGFQTAISVPASSTPPLPHPPPQLFVRTDYTSSRNLSLPAFVTPDPKDGQKHPAIIWLTGGDSNSLDDFWSPGPESNDQSAKAFREAGLIMMFPTLRGGNANPGGKEFLFGEVEDVLAAADHLARLAYVDPTQIHLGGHSTGGTLALLTAESSGRFKAVFAFGPVAEVNRYPPSVVPVNFTQYEEREIKLRSPIHWLSGISAPTYIIEGTNGPANTEDFAALCQKSRNPQLHCIPVEGSDHFSSLAKVTKVIAARLAVGGYGTEFALRPDEFRQASASSKP